MTPITLIPLRFGAFQSYIIQKTSSPIGLRKGVLDVATLQDVWTFIGRPPKSGVDQIEFPDHSTAFFRSNREADLETPSGGFSEGVLHDCGAYRLNRMLGLKIVPETLPVDLRSTGKSAFKTGSLQEGIAGERLDRCSAEEIQTVLKKKQDNLVELYLYTVVSYDWDKVDRNIILEKATQQLYAIDNELSGMDPMQCYFPLKLPAAIKTFYHGQPIPKKYLTKLQRFISNRPAYEKELRHYYEPEAVAGMFNRAQLLLDIGTLLPIEEMRPKIPNAYNLHL